MFFDIFKALCDERGVSCKRAAEAVGLSNSITTKWKTTGATPRGTTLSSIANYFNVPISFLLEEPPFNHWGLIDQNRKGFLRCTDISPDTLRVIFGIDPDNPNSARIIDFVSFMASAIETAEPTTNGKWNITMHPAYKRKSVPAKTNRHDESLLDAGFFRVMQSAKDKGYTPEDVELAIDFLARARKRDETL